MDITVDAAAVNAANKKPVDAAKYDGMGYADNCKRYTKDGDCVVFSPLSQWNANRTRYDSEIRTDDDMKTAFLDDGSLRQRYGSYFESTDGFLSFAPALKIIYQHHGDESDNDALAKAVEIGALECAGVTGIIDRETNLPGTPVQEQIYQNMNVYWAANKRLETSKFKFKFPRARTIELIWLVLGCIEAKFCK